MSEFIHRINRIKTQCDATWLTPSQKIAVDQLRRLLQTPTFVNLYGRNGVGKTFLAWQFADEMQFNYITHPNKLPNGKRPIIVDNCLSSRQQYRALLKEFSFRGIDKAILLSRNAIDDYVGIVPLLLTEQDLSIVEEHLRLVGLTVKRPQVPNLWHLVNPVLEG